jgi:arabinoxylan arabinofuranohydrolase
MKSENAVDGSAGTYRSISVNKATVNESTQTINKVTLNLEGVEAIGTLNPYKEQQAETMATCGGIEYEDFTNVKKNGRISNLGNDASANLQVKMVEGAWTQLRKVDFGTVGADSFMIRAKGTGTLEIRLTRTGKAVATIDCSSTTFTDQKIKVDPSVFKGVKTSIYLVCTSATNFYVDAWQFSEPQPDAIKVPYAAPKEDDGVMFDLNGRRLNSHSNGRGLYIQNGKKVLVK